MAKYHLKPEDGYEMIAAQRRRMLLVFSPWVVASVLVALWLSSSVPVAAGFFAGMAAAWIVSGASEWIQAPKRYAQRCRSYTEPVTVTIDTDSLRAETQFGSMVVRKSRVTRIEVLPRSFVLEIAGVPASVLPRAYLSRDETALLEAWAAERNR